MLHTCRVFAAAASLLLAAPALPAQSNAVLPRLLPPETALVLHIRDIQGLRASLKHTPLARTWEEPEVQACIGPWWKALAAKGPGELAGKLQADTGLTPDELLEMFSGEALAAVLDFSPYLRDEEAKAPQILIAIQLGKNRARFEEMIRRVQKKEGSLEREEEFQGEQLHVAMADDGTEGEAWVFLGDAFVVAEPKAVLQRAVTQWHDGDRRESLAGAVRFVDMYRRQPDAQLSAFFNLRSLVPIVVQALEQERRARPEGDPAAAGMIATPEALARGLGLDALESIYVTASVGEKSSDVAAGLTWQEARGLLRVLAYGDPPAPRPDFIPDSWEYVATSRFSFVTAFEALLETFGEVSPEFGAQVRNQIASLNQSLGIDIQRDIVGSLGDELVNAYSIRQLANGEVDADQPADQLMAISLADAVTFRRAIDAILSIAPPGLTQQIKGREYLGETIHTFGEPSDPAADGPGVRQVSYAITADRLFLCIGSPSMLETALQGAGGAAKSIWKKPEVAAALATLPPGGASLEYVDMKRFAVLGFGLAMRLLKTMPGLAAEGAPVEPGPPPSPETIGKHWGSLVSALYRENDGLHAVMRIDHAE